MLFKHIMKISLTLTFLLLTALCFGQNAKQKVYYDTVVTKHFKYEPDTIPVYFKEVVLGNQIYESWNYGFVVWQTYKQAVSIGGLTWDGGSYITFGNDTSYFENPYPFPSLPPGKFLYMNKKPVTNKVIYTIKR